MLRSARTSKTRFSCRGVVYAANHCKEGSLAEEAGALLIIMVACCSISGKAPPSLLGGLFFHSLLGLRILIDESEPATYRTNLTCVPRGLVSQFFVRTFLSSANGPEFRLHRKGSLVVGKRHRLFTSLQNVDASANRPPQDPGRRAYAQVSVENYIRTIA